uniref:Uncharacterized protein n=1 Tax=Culex tarsalis TaxID=7177 RepID=A0A1Q3FXY8_CULTA
MDVYYMSDSIQYGSFRNPLYRDYEKFPYGTLENTLNSPPKSGGMQQNQQRNQTSSLVAGQAKSKGKSAKDSCPFCKEQKKRPLGAYMRKRGQRITTESISEDAEEQDEGSELQDDFEGASSSCSSPSGSPSAAELATGEQQQQHNHHHHRHGSGYGRQESQDSGCEAK